MTTAARRHDFPRAVAASQGMLRALGNTFLLRVARLLRSPEFAEIFAEGALKRVARGKLEAALVIAQMAIEAGPDLAPPYRAQAWAYRCRHQSDFARRVYRLGLARVPDPEGRADLLTDLGDLEASLGRHEAAADAYEQALALTPSDDLRARFARAQAAEQATTSGADRQQSRGE